MRLPALPGAWLDSTPTLFISGQVKRADRMYHADGTPLGVRQRGNQEVDIPSIVRPITKYAITVVDPQSIRFHLEKAVHLARTGRPGPVWIDIPLDVQAISVDPDSLPGFAAPAAEQVQSAALVSQVREIIERLNQSERPANLCGKWRTGFPRRSCVSETGAKAPNAGGLDLAGHGLAGRQ